MSAPATVDKHASYNKPKLFVLSVIALATAGMAFGIRGDIGGALQGHFFDPIDPANSARLIGEVVGILFLGFAFAIADELHLRQFDSGIAFCAMDHPSTGATGFMNLPAMPRWWRRRELNPRP